jgi:hypothetical protein
MLSDRDLLFIEPQAPASAAPLIDSLYFGTATLSRFSNAGIDLASLYFSTEGTPQCGALLHYHALSNFRDCPQEAVSEFIGAIRQAHDLLESWIAQAFLACALGRGVDPASTRARWPSGAHRSCVGVGVPRQDRDAG